MEQNIRDNGLMEKLMEKGNLCMPMEMSMMGNGKMIRLMDMGYIHIAMERSMKGSGKMTHRMEKVPKLGLMEVSIVENIKMEKNMD
jgi:hypothetical protein